MRELENEYWKFHSGRCDLEWGLSSRPILHVIGRTTYNVNERRRRCLQSPVNYVRRYSCLKAVCRRCRRQLKLLAIVAISLTLRIFWANLAALLLDILVPPSACALLEDQPMNCGRAVVRPAIWDKRKPRKTRYAMINVWPKTSYFTRTESSTGWNKKLAISFNTLAGGVRDQAVDLVTLLLLQNSHNNGLRWI